MSPITGLLPGRPPESLRPRLRRDRHDPAGRTSQIHRNPRTTSCYRATSFAGAIRELGLKHLRIRPYRPRTNGKAERFIQTLLNEWAYDRIYGSSTERAAALPRYLERYNFRRPHGSLSHKPPASRLTNVPGNYT